MAVSPVMVYLIIKINDTILSMNNKSLLYFYSPANCMILFYKVKLNNHNLYIFWISIFKFIILNIHILYFFQKVTALY